MLKELAMREVSIISKKMSKRVLIETEITSLLTVHGLLKLEFIGVCLRNL